MGNKLTEQDYGEITRFYNERHSEKGDEIQSVGWKDKQTQFLRFEQLFKDFDPTGKTILDVGCGFADLVDFLNGITGGRFNYIGIDISQSLLETAKKKYNSSNCKFIECDIHQVSELLNCPIDFAVESGALTYRITDNESYALSVLENMFGIARDGVALNFMSDQVDYQLEKNYHYSPSKVLSWGLSLSRNVSLSHDYGLNEFTLRVMR